MSKEKRTKYTNDVLRNIKEFCKVHYECLNDEIREIHKSLDNGNHINDNYMLLQLKYLEGLVCQYSKIMCKNSSSKTKTTLEQANKDNDVVVQHNSNAEAEQGKDEEEITNTEWYQADLNDAPCDCLEGIILTVKAKSFEEAYEMMFEALIDSAYEEEFKKQLISSIEILKKDKVNIIVYSA